jgi:hypothetical protein
LAPHRRASPASAMSMGAICTTRVSDLRRALVRATTGGTTN